MPVFLPGESQEPRYLAGCLWGHKELDITEQLTHTHTGIKPRQTFKWQIVCKKPGPTRKQAQIHQRCRPLHFSSRLALLQMPEVQSIELEQLGLKEGFSH